jgi:hypothetical protein
MWKERFWPIDVTISLFVRVSPDAAPRGLSRTRVNVYSGPNRRLTNKVTISPSKLNVDAVLSSETLIPSAIVIFNHSVIFVLIQCSLFL